MITRKILGVLMCGVAGAALACSSSSGPDTPAVSESLSSLDLSLLTASGATDDDAIGGHSIRRGSIPCGAFF